MMTLTTEAVESLIAGGETLTVEFKSEQRQRLPDREVYEAVVCLANTDGGVLLLGMENDGSITGAKPRHNDAIDPRQLQAAIFNNTMPSINTRISLHELNGLTLVAIEVDSYPEICSTRDGRCVRRVEGIGGPECQPFYPHEHASRRSDLGLVDHSAQRVEGASWADLDPLEIERLRQTIEQRRGDTALLALDDRELVQALRLAETYSGDLVPNIAGLLLLGREPVLRKVLPTNAVAFQVIDEKNDVLVNDWFYSPILKTLEAVEQRFAARHSEQEIIVGMFRLPVPDYSPDAFREAVNNAVLHRDYTRQGSVHVQWHPDHLLITNPGGFLEGITLSNILAHEPKPRNPCLANAFLRIGLVEATGRGVDEIFRGQVQFGRPLPDYHLSNREGVRLMLRGGDANLDFVSFVYQQARAGNTLSLEELMVLNHLQFERRIDISEASRLIQKGDARARNTMERLVEQGLVDARGERQGRVYLLSSVVYRALGEPSGYVRLRGFDAIQQETMVLQYVEAHGRITRREAVELCKLSKDQASHLLRRLTQQGKLLQQGQLRGTYYEIP